MKKNENGFSIVEIFIVIVVIGLIGTAGWLVVKNRAKKNVSSSAPATSETVNEVEDTPTSTDTSKHVLTTYTSSNNKFSVLVPKEINNSYGNCKKDGNGLFVPENTWTPSKVFESGEKVYISVQSFYDQNDDRTTCTKLTNSFAITDDREINRDTTYSSFEVLPLFIGAASNENEINTFLKRNIWDNYKVGQLVSKPNSEWQEVKLALVNEETDTGQGKTVVRYYPARHKVIAWNIGQYNHYVDPGDDNSPDYTLQMVDSFKFN